MPRFVPIILRIITLLETREQDETQQWRDHPIDDYQKGRALATRQIREEIVRIIEG